MSWGIFRRGTGVPSDVFVKIGAVLAAWTHAGVVFKLLPIFLYTPPLVPAFTRDWFLLFGLHGAAIACAIAYWNMKRWGAVGLAAIGAMRFAASAPYNLRGAVLLVVIFTVLPLIPAVIRWRSMTWR